MCEACGFVGYCHGDPLVDLFVNTSGELVCYKRFIRGAWTFVSLSVNYVILTKKDKYLIRVAVGELESLKTQLLTIASSRFNLGCLVHTDLQGSQVRLDFIIHILRSVFKTWLGSESATLCNLIEVAHYLVHKVRITLSLSVFWMCNSLIMLCLKV